MSGRLSELYAATGCALPPDATEADLRRLLRAARDRWPGVDVDAAVFVPALARAAGESGLPDEAAAADIYLAHACARADRTALAAFEGAYFGGIGPALARMGLAKVQVEDVIQAVRKRLFIDRVDGQVRVVTAAGRGDLGGLAKVAAVRIALNTVRGDRRRTERHELIAEQAWDGGLDDPELQLLRADQKAAFKAAFEAAIGGIDHRSRNLLRLHLVEHLSIDQIAAVFGTHRSTAARWLGRAREEVARRTEQALAERLARPHADIGDALALVRSRLELSLSRLLATREPHPASTPPTDSSRS